jgi:hypothetical protein
MNMKQKKHTTPMPIPDWYEFWTEAEATRGLAHFNFNGPGLYCAEDDLILVTPSGSRPPEDLYLFQVFNGMKLEEFRRDMKALSAAPVRLLVRDVKVKTLTGSKTRTVVRVIGTGGEAIATNDGDD